VAELNAEHRRGLDARIRRRIADLPEFAAARRVFAYLALEDEPDMGALLHHAIASGKRVFVSMVGDRSVLRYARWPVHGSEPSSLLCDQAIAEDPTSLSVILVPGRAFDHKGHRLGRGGGCYDRAMEQLAELGTTVGVAYALQLVGAVPREPHDRAVQLVITECETLRIVP
jgi:5-formyltetrahydrofolate cyclo-ligase